jgi:dsRNA-specific ribonuclease
VRVICNKFLRRVSILGRLTRYILCKSSKWHISGLRQEEQTYRAIPPKTMADAVESAIGMIYTSTYSLEWCRKYLLEMGVLTWPSWAVHNPPGQLSGLPLSARLAELQVRVGHSFRNPGLLCQALTNHSAA